MSTPFVGQIALFTFPFAPRGWHLCDGSVLPISQNQALFALIGTTYGGNGTTTFALPDLRSRVPVCQGTGPGLSTYTLGQSGGVQTQSLTASNLPPHTHPATLNISTTNGALNVSANNYLAAKNDSIVPTPPPTTVAMNPASITVQPNAGSSAPFSVVEPYLTFNFCIALQGIFPSRS